MHPPEPEQNIPGDPLWKNPFQKLLLKRPRQHLGNGLWWEEADNFVRKEDVSSVTAVSNSPRS